MKKKLLLIALPALMALSGCANVSIKPAEQKAPAIELMAEDNLAHEEIFGGLEDSAKLVKTNVSKLAALEADDVKVGYQIKFAENGEGTADDTISIRFVAAIKSDGVDAYWSRGLAQPNGYEGAEPDPVGHPGVWNFKFSDTSTHKSSVIYDKLTSDGSPIEAGSGDYEDYEGFVIYTLRNIPYEDYKDSYLAAYVTLVDKTNSSNYLRSQGVAVKIERNGAESKNRFYFDASYTGHFLEGTINNALRNGSDNSSHALLRANESAGDAYWAKYLDVDLLTTDSFGSFYYSFSDTPEDCHFQFFGRTSFFGDSSALLQGSASLNDFNAPKNAGKYSLFVQNDTGTANHVSTYKLGADETYHMQGLPDWTGPNAKTFVGYCDASGNENNWVVATIDGTNGTFVAPNNIQRFWIARCHPDTVTPNWSESENVAGKVYNSSPSDTYVTVGYYYYNCTVA